MARYTKVLKSLSHNAVGNRRIAAAAPAGNNYYVTGATLGDQPNYTLTLARNGGLSNVTVNLDSLATTSNPGGSSNDIQYNNAGSFGGITIAQGGILSATDAGLPSVLASGADGYALVADSTTTTGLNWAVNQDGNYYVTGGTYSAGEIDFSGTTSFPDFTVTGIPTGTTTATNTQTFTNKTWNGVAIGDTYISSATNWNDAYDNYVASAAYSAGTLTFTQRDGGTFTATGFETGDVTGGGADTYVSYWTSATNVTGTSSLTYDGTNTFNIVPTNADATLNLGAGNVVLRYTSSVGQLHSANRTLKVGNSGGQIKFLNGTDDSIHFFTSGTSSEKMTILNTGKVGIGTTAPAAKLDVLSTTEQLRLSYDGSEYATFTVDNAGGMSIVTTNSTTLTGSRHLELGAGANRDIRFFWGGDERVTFLESSNLARVGINATAPAYALDVVGTTQLSGAATLTSTATVGSTLVVTGATTAKTTLTVSGNTTLQNPMIIETGSVTKFNFKPDDQAEEVLITGTKVTTAADEYAYYPRITLHSDETGDAVSQPGYPTIFFTKYGPTSVGNPAGDPVGWRFAASGAGGIATAPQYMVWDYSTDQSTYSNKMHLNEQGHLTATSFMGSLSGTIDSATTATTQSASDNSTKVATTAYADAAAGGAGTIGGSITDNQVAVGATTADSIEGSANLTWDATTLDVQGSILVDPSTGSDTAGTSAGIKFNAQDDSGVGWNLRLGDTLSLIHI